MRAIPGARVIPAASVAVCIRRLTTSSGYAIVCPITPATPPHTALRCGGSSAVGGRPRDRSIRSFSVSYVDHVVPL